MVEGPSFSLSKYIYFPEFRYIWQHNWSSISNSPNWSYGEGGSTLRKALWPNSFTCLYVASTEALKYGEKTKPVPMSLCDVSWNIHWKLPRSVPVLQLMFIFVVSHWCNYVEFDDRHAVGNHSQSVLLLVMSIMILQNGKINFQQAPYSLTSSQVNYTP